MLKSFIQRFLTNQEQAALIVPRKKKPGLWYGLAGGVLCGTLLLGLFLGSVNVSIPSIFHTLIHKLFGIVWLTDVSAIQQQIIWDIRLPRVLLAALVGAALALAGAAFQGLLRNPLADPYTLGVSSGAALGAVAVLYFNISIIVFGAFTLPIVAIIAGLVTMLAVYGLTILTRRGLTVETLILAGIVVSSFLSSIITLFIALSGEELRYILYWIMGSVGMRGWSHVGLMLPFFLLGSLLLLLQYRELNAYALGENAAQHLGVNVHRSKLFILVGASLLTGASVAVSGMIGFVGLVIPHLVRLLVGPNHKHLLPLSIFTGAIFLILADIVARTVIAPKELPIGVITALVGAPVFALLLIREKYKR